MSWTTRPCTSADAAAITELARRHDLAEFGTVEVELSDIEQILGGDGEGVVALNDADGAAVGFAHVKPSGECETFVDPAYDPRMRRALIELLRVRGRALGAVKLEHWTGPAERFTAPLLAALGFQRATTTWQLRHDLSGLPEPVWPEGVLLHPFDLERHGREVWEVVTEAFRHTGLSRDRDYEEWAWLSLTDADVLCARRAGRLVGAATHGTRLGCGYVRQLAVDQAERGRGLGRARLLEACRRDRDHGLPATTLSVDGRNDRARRLYDSIGMTVTQEYRRWDLAL